MRAEAGLRTVGPGDWNVLEVDPPGVRSVSATLREHSNLVANQRRVCGGIDVAPGDPTVGAGLARFTGIWGSAAGALAHELALLGVELAMTDLQGVGGVLGSLAGEVEHDTQSIRQSWPKGRTGGLAAADAARMSGALDECHQVFGRAERALSELYPVLVAGRRKVDGLNHAYLVLAGPVNTYDGTLAAAFPSLARPQQLFVAEDTLKATRARSGFESLAEIDRAYAQVRAQVTEETTICDELLNQLAALGSALPGHAAGQSKFDVSFGLLGATNQVAGILDGSIRFPSDPIGVHQAWLQLSPDQRAQLLACDPGRFGNLNGIPAADRNTANRATLSAQLLLLEKACEEVGIAIPNRPEDFDRIPPVLRVSLGRVTQLDGGHHVQDPC